MPIFDFECQDCGKSFDKMISYIDKDRFMPNATPPI